MQQDQPKRCLVRVGFILPHAAFATDQPGDLLPAGFGQGWGLGELALNPGADTQLRGSWFAFQLLAFRSSKTTGGAVPVLPAPPGGYDQRNV